MRTDNEKVLRSSFRKLLKNEGIQIETSVAYTSEQNGFAESSGNRICTVARAIRIHSGIPQDLWPELVHTAVYLLNRTPKKGLNWATSFEAYNCHKPDVSNIKKVGCRAYVHIPKEKRMASAKLAERAWIGFLIGFEAHNIWRIWHPKSRQVLRVRDVIFREDCLNKDDINKVDIPVEIDKFSSMVGPSDDDVFQPYLNRWNLSEDVSITKIKDSNEAKATKFSALDGQDRTDLYQEEDIEFQVPGNFSDPEPDMEVCESSERT